VEPPLLRVGMLSPMPARAGQLPESGVAAYTASLVAALPDDLAVTVLAQETTNAQQLGNVKVLPTWTPDRRLPWQVDRTVAALALDVLHVQHEFNLYGGLLQGGLLTAALLRIHSRGTPIVTTVHGVVEIPSRPRCELFAPDFAQLTARSHRLLTS
jgi:hypothetical protein